MTITTKVELMPFLTPNFVIQKVEPGKREEGLRHVPQYALAELDADVLDALCNEFRSEIFKKAGKRDPLQCVTLTA
jgi:hypothetical protein